MKGNYLARRMDNGEVIEGNLICKEGSPFVYILTHENYDKMCVDELNGGKTHCNLVRVIGESVEQTN